MFYTYILRSINHPDQAIKKHRSSFSSLLKIPINHCVLKRKSVSLSKIIRRSFLLNLILPNTPIHSIMIFPTLILSTGKRILPLRKNISFSLYLSDRDSNLTFCPFRDVDLLMDRSSKFTAVVCLKKDYFFNLT